MDNQLRTMKVGRTTISWRITTDNEIEIGSVRTPQTARNTGSATAAMTEFCQMADKMGLPIILGASPLDKRTKLGRLVAFYRKFGFEPTGKSINIVGDPYMRREPKNIITAAVRIRHYLLAKTDPSPFKVMPRMGESFEDWMDRVYSDENRGPDNKIVFPDVYYRGVSDGEYEAARKAGEFAPIDAEEDAVFVEKNPDRYIGGGSYGAKKAGYILQFDTRGLKVRPLKSRHIKGMKEDGLARIPFDRITRIWRWDSNEKQHLLVKAPEA